MSNTEIAAGVNAMTEALAGLNSVLEARKSELQQVGARIQELEAEKQNVESAPPHTDDIVRVFMCGVAQYTGEFERQFSAHLKAVYTDAGSAAAVSPQNAPNILTIEGRKPSVEEARDRTMRKEVLPLNMSALVYLLGDRIRDELPALVAKLCPAAAQGMKGSERAATLLAINRELATLRGKHATLSAELNEAVKMVRETTGR